MGRTRGGCQSKIADDGGVFGDEDIFAERRFFAEKFVELFCQFVHEEILIAIRLIVADFSNWFKARRVLKY